MEDQMNPRDEGMPTQLAFNQKIRSEMKQSAKWARRVAMGQAVIFGGFILVIFSALFFAASSRLGMIPPGGLFMGLLVSTLLFLPIFFLFRYAGHMKKALSFDDQHAMEEACYNMKRYWYLMWTYMLVGLVIYGLVFFFWLLALGVSGTGGGVGI